MATRTSTRLLVVVALIGAGVYFAPKALDGIGELISDVTTASDANGCQGGLYVRQYPPDGERFLVVISNPDHVATEPFTGTDIATDQNCQ